MKNDRRNRKRTKLTSESMAWYGLKNRCLNPKNKAFKYYGGRGIKVCERWMEFKGFIADMGLKPSPKHSLDRINNDGDYEPGNCRWTDKITQMNNRTMCIPLTVDGITKNAAQWSRESRIGLSAKRINHRIRSGWSPSMAVLTPSRFAAQTMTILKIPFVDFPHNFKTAQ